MKFLVDTHTLLWFAENDPKLSVTAKANLENSSNERLISIVSFWEMAIKVGLKKLSLIQSLEETVDGILEKDFEILPIKLEHTLKVAELPLHHRDPFDRLLAVQCLSENLTLISKDSIFDEYGVERGW